MKVLINSQLCYACKTCQIVCSFHHTQAFWPEKSSIHISRNYQNGDINCYIDSTCDECRGENMPLCFKFCSYDAIQILKDDNLNEEMNE